MSILIFHLIFLHSPSSNNPLSFNFNNKISFFPSLYLKDFFYFMSLTLALFYEEILFTILTFSHPDNYFEASSLNTPNHIVPEWYFLSLYAILKCISSKILGSLFLFTSIIILFIFGEDASLFISFAEGYSNFFFLIIFLLLFIGGEIPFKIFLLYGRLLTFFYLFLINYL